MLLHVDEPKPAHVGSDAVVAAWQLATPKRISHLEARLASLADALEYSGVKVECVALVGLVVDDILEQAEKIPCRLTSSWVPIGTLRRSTSSMETSSPAS